MTSEEIVKALRQCAKSDCSSCGICPIFPDRECVEHLATAAANLIEQLIDENTELREEVNLRGNAVRTYEKKRAEAEAERDALREKQRWIPVTERMPELEVPVLVLDRRGNMIVRTLRRLVSDKEAVFRPDGLAPRKNITNWMPLPGAPEGEKV